jgi:hypothetical protein
MSKYQLLFGAMVALVVAIAFSFGYKFLKTPEQRLKDLCIETLEDKLNNYAKYSGWNTKRAKADIVSISPDIETNEKYKVDFFYKFEVVISNFTVKNGFNADINSFASCEGNGISKTDGKYNPPSTSLGIVIKMNGEKIGIF